MMIILVDLLFECCLFTHPIFRLMPESALLASKEKKLTGRGYFESGRASAAVLFWLSILVSDYVVRFWIFRCDLLVEVLELKIRVTRISSTIHPYLLPRLGLWLDRKEGRLLQMKGMATKMMTLTLMMMSLTTKVIHLAIAVVCKGSSIARCVFAS
jgi:hypothetical protein